MISRAFSHGFVLVALALATLRGLIAPGLMLSTDPTRGLVLVVCSSHAAAERIFLTPAGDFVLESEVPKSEASDDPCPFAVAMQLVRAEPPAMESRVVAFARLVRFVGAPAVSIGLGLAAPPPPAIGPPSSR